MSDTKLLFKENAYLKNTYAKVVSVNERGGIVLDQTVFYVTGGGQPGDCGTFVHNGRSIEIVTTVYDRDTKQVVHVPAASSELNVGDEVETAIDWQSRYKHMQMHTALHLLCSLVPCGVTGGQIGATKSRLDFDVGETVLDKEQLTLQINQLIDAKHAVSTRWVDDEYLDAHPNLVKTMSVKPPRGVGKLRLLEIAPNIDLQPCGGTHVKNTSEIAKLRVSKIENKGKKNRRVNIIFDE
jgi:misacylated tRNA(Ala) deacylase